MQQNISQRIVIKLSYYHIPLFRMGFVQLIKCTKRNTILVIVFYGWQFYCYRQVRSLLKKMVGKVVYVGVNFNLLLSLWMVVQQILCQQIVLGILLMALNQI